jgi:hypothetical protein
MMDNLLFKYEIYLERIMAWGCHVVLGYMLLGTLRFVCSTFTSFIS